MRIITEPSELISNYVSRMAHLGPISGACATIALVNDDEEIIAGAVFNGYKWPNIWLSIAAEKVTPAFVAAIIHYPFVQLKCRRISGIVESSNEASKR